MAIIERVEISKVDLIPKVKRTDAIQSFVSQETPIVSIPISRAVLATRTAISPRLAISSERICIRES